MLIIIRMRGYSPDPDNSVGSDPAVRMNFEGGLGSVVLQHSTAQQCAPSQLTSLIIYEEETLGTICDLVIFHHIMAKLSIEEEAERKVGWLLKMIFFGTAGVAGYHFFPYMGDNLMQQSVSLLRVKDPLFKRMGASRLARFAIDDERRKTIVEMGGAKELLNMLSTAKDDRTRKAALHALDALSHSDEALASLHHAGAISVIRSAPNSLEDAEVERFKLSLMKRFQDLRYDINDYNKLALKVQ
ncbi:hypothetical protein CR513_20101, partial [Mucuna pruriens]